MSTLILQLYNLKKEYLIQAIASVIFIASLFYIDEDVGFSWVSITAERVAFLVFFAMFVGFQLFFSKIVLKRYNGKGKVIISMFGSVAVLFSLIIFLGLLLTIVK